MTNKVKTQFQCRHLQEGRRLWVLQYRWNFCRTAWLDRKDSKYRNRNSTNTLLHNHSWCGNTIQKSSDCLFWFSIGSNVMDQRSGVGRFGGWFKIIAINSCSRCWTRELHLLWTRSSRIPSSRKRSVSRNRKPRKRTGFYEEDRSLSLSTTTFELLALMIQCWFLLVCSLLLFIKIMFRNSIQDGMKFYYLCQRFHPMMSWKVCTN